MKTTLEIPDAPFRRAKSVAATTEAGKKPWMKPFGKLRGLRKETTRINRVIEEEFGKVEPEDRQ